MDVKKEKMKKKERFETFLKQKSLTSARALCGTIMALQKTRFPDIFLSHFQLFTDRQFTNILLIIVFERSQKPQPV